MSEQDEAKEKAIMKYKILAGVLGLLGGGLLICAILAVNKQNDEDYGLPYYVGGFAVGILALISAAICLFICLKAPDANSEVKKRELACAMQGHYILSIFMIMGCLMGCTYAGMGGFGVSTYEDDDGSKKTLAIIIFLGCIVATVVTIFSLCVMCTYGAYFGVHMQRGRMMVWNATGPGATTTIHASPFQTTTFTTGNNQQTNQLQQQNLLLQQQLELQRQLNQQQTQYSGGIYPPPPQSTYGISPAYSPDAPPPSYDAVK